MAYSVLEITLKGSMDTDILLLSKGREMEIRIFGLTERIMRRPHREGHDGLVKMIRAIACATRAEELSVRTFDTEDEYDQEKFLTHQSWDDDELLEDFIKVQKRMAKWNEDLDRHDEVDTPCMDMFVLLADKCSDILMTTLNMWANEVNLQEKIQKFKKLIEKDPKCPILLEDLTIETAVLLPCQHIISREASAKLFATYEAPCPLCRQKTLRSNLEVLY